MSITTHMNTGFVDYSRPTYDEVHRSVSHITNFIRHSDTGIHKVEAIVGIARGGNLPALILSHQLNLPSHTIYYSSTRGNGDNKNHANTLPTFTEHTLIFVDDMVDSGYTMEEVCTEYRSRGHEVYSAVVYYRESLLPIHIPDVWAVKISRNFRWITFPFEEK